MKKLILLFLFASCIRAAACDCPPLTPLSKATFSSYDGIFYGTVDSVSSCDAKGLATVYFSLDALYKGSLKKHTAVLFECSSDCLMSFATGERWIIYGSFLRFDKLKVDFCGHSRKLPQDEKADPYFLQSHRTFTEELDLLQKDPGVQQFADANELNDQQQELRPHNDQPSPMSKLWLLLGGFVTMALVYFFTRRRK